MNTGPHSLSAQERSLLNEVRARGRILTRLKELGYRDVEVVQPPLGTMARIDGEGPRDRGLSEEQILACLHALERRGILVVSVTAFSASSTEYICEWRLTAEVSGQPLPES
jgi:hypothetical protein